MSEPPRRLGLGTRAVHAGTEGNSTRALSPPIWQTSTFRLDSAAQGAELTAATGPAEFYTRWGNPTTHELAAAVADLEGAEAALAASSGMAAITLLVFASVKAGDHVIVGRSLYAGATELVTGLLPGYGVTVTAVDAADEQALRAAFRPQTRLVLVETPANPTLALCDLARIAAQGREAGVLTAVDNTFATPIHQRPLAHGIDAVVHSATKYLGGHSDATGGVLCGSQALVDRAWARLKLLGPCLSPFEAWLILRGVRSLAVRVERQGNTALELAGFLESHSAVSRVHYPGLASHPQHDLARRQMDGFGGMVSFELRGGYEAAVRVAESLELIGLAVSLGGVESTISHPASMSHGTLSAEERAATGVAPGLLRLSVGLEDPGDLRADLERALVG